MSVKVASHNNSHPHMMRSGTPTSRLHGQPPTPPTANLNLTSPANKAELHHGHSHGGGSTTPLQRSLHQQSSAPNTPNSNCPHEESASVMSSMGGPTGTTRSSLRSGSGGGTGTGVPTYSQPAGTGSSAHNSSDPSFPPTAAQHHIRALEPHELMNHLAAARKKVATAIVSVHDSLEEMHSLAALLAAHGHTELDTVVRRPAAIASSMTAATQRRFQQGEAELQRDAAIAQQRVQRQRAAPLAVTMNNDAGDIMADVLSEATALYYRTLKDLVSNTAAVLEAKPTPGRQVQQRPPMEPTIAQLHLQQQHQNQAPSTRPASEVSGPAPLGRRASGGMIAAATPDASLTDIAPQPVQRNTPSNNNSNTTPAGYTQSQPQPQPQPMPLPHHRERKHSGSGSGRLTRISSTSSATTRASTKQPPSPAHIAAPMPQSINPPHHAFHGGSYDRTADGTEDVVLG